MIHAALNAAATESGKAALAAEVDADQAAGDP